MEIIFIGLGLIALFVLGNAKGSSHSKSKSKHGGHGKHDSGGHGKKH